MKRWVLLKYYALAFAKSSQTDLSVYHKRFIILAHGSEFKATK